MSAKVKSKVVKLKIESSNSERVKQVQAVLRQRVQEGAEDSRAFRKIVYKQIGGFTEGEYLKAKEVVDSGDSNNIFIMNFKGLTAGYNKVKPKIRKPRKVVYKLNEVSSDQLRWIAFRYYEGKTPNGLLEDIFKVSEKDYITEYRGYTDDERMRKFAYKKKERLIEVEKT